MTPEMHEQAAQKHLDAIEAVGVFSPDQRIQLAIAHALLGVYQELGNIRENGGQVVSQLNTINAWLHGNTTGRPEVVIHRAEDMTVGASMDAQDGFPDPWDD